MMALLEAHDLRVRISDGRREFMAVDGVSLELERGGSLAIVGESGSGKTLTLKALLDLLPPNAELVDGEVRFGVDREPRAVKPASLRGSGIAMVFQEPMSALNPLRRVGDLLSDAWRATHEGSRAQANARALGLLDEVGIPDRVRRMRAYPHQLSGGQRQRVMIAMALASEPRVLLCDEPTTAVDVTVQSQILELLAGIRRERGLALIYVTHDLALVGQICERVMVMYAGRAVETGMVEQVFSAPAHPYTQALLRSVPTIDARIEGLATIPGAPPDPRAGYPAGCRFHPRCPLVREDCTRASYLLEPAGAGRATACIHPEEVARLGEGVPA
jgi:peptide/nickel transport system ATP-binding protein